MSDYSYGFQELDNICPVCRQVIRRLILLSNPPQYRNECGCKTDNKWSLNDDHRKCEKTVTIPKEIYEALWIIARAHGWTTLGDMEKEAKCSR